MIFYFSGTGNTQWVATELARTTQDELRFIPDELRKGTTDYRLKEGERIGFCFPAHGWQPPHIVREFIQRLTLHLFGRHFCYVVVTCGDSIGESVAIFEKDLAQRSITVNSAFSVIMPESYVCLPFMYTDTPEREQQKLGNARHLMIHIVDVIKNRVDNVRELEKGATPRLILMSLAVSSIPT